MSFSVNYCILIQYYLYFAGEIGYKSVMKNLKNSYCEIDSRSLNTSNWEDDEIFSNNLTSINKINFNDLTQDYNFDDLIIYFDNALPSDIVLQLQFRCNSIVIPIYNDQYPYNLVNSHTNYKLRMNIKTLSCQYGEIKNSTDFSCIPCNSDQGLFSLNINSEKCQLKDDISTVSVQPALLNIKFGFWRPYFQSNIVSYCLNLEDNCLGGWEEGDSSCFIGHIGALCEQCDLYNTRGDGEYSVSQKYSCGSCLEKEKNAIIITFVSIWYILQIKSQDLGFDISFCAKYFKRHRRICQNYQYNIARVSSYLKYKSICDINKNADELFVDHFFYSYRCYLYFIYTFQLKLPNGLQSKVDK